MIRLWAITFLFAIGPVASLTDPLPDPVTEDMFSPVDNDQALLGQLLFYDPILSGTVSYTHLTLPTIYSV